MKYSDRGWEALNEFSIAKVAEDAGWIVTGLHERRGESTPGRVWLLGLWAERDGSGEPDYTREHVEHAPPRRVGCPGRSSGRPPMPTGTWTSPRPAT